MNKQILNNWLLNEHYQFCAQEEAEVLWKKTACECILMYMQKEINYGRRGILNYDSSYLASV